MGKDKDLSYYKANAEEDYKQVPISVLRYITELETEVSSLSASNITEQRELFKGFLEKAVEEIEMNCGDLPWELQDEAKKLLKLFNCG